MKRIVIAYHVYMFGNNYMALIIDQIRKIMRTGLYKASDKIYVGINDCWNKKPDTGIDWIKGVLSFRSGKDYHPSMGKVEIQVYDDNQELRRTLRWIRDYAKENPGDYVLFLHTKGITHYTEATEDWRAYMEYFVVERWKDCVTKLDEGYDCCGVLWNTDTPIGKYPHFSGAFYWATCKYINTLNHFYIDSSWRYHMEFWIGSNPEVKAYEFHNSGYNTTQRLIANQGHYHIPYPRTNYSK